MGALVGFYWGRVQGCSHVGTARQTAFTACVGDLFLEANYMPSLVL